MRKLSDLIKENESTKCFKYNATVTVEGSVYAENEGSAGEMVDKNMDEIPGMVNYEIISIEEESSEGYINPDLAIGSEISEDVNTNNADDRLEIIKKYIHDTFNSTIIPLNIQEKIYILGKLKDYINQLNNSL